MQAGQTCTATGTIRQNIPARGCVILTQTRACHERTDEI